MKFTRVRSPLNYPGAKYRLSKRIFEFVPFDTIDMVSPFFGSGVVEMNIAFNLGTRVYGYDIYSPLINFWRFYLDNPESLMIHVRQMLSDLTDDDIAFYITHPAKMVSLKRLAALYFVWNRLTHCGKTVEGWKPYIADFYVDLYGDPFRINENGKDIHVISPVIHKFYDKYHKLLDVEVGCLGFEESLAAHPDCFAYCDPPYIVNHKLYGLDRKQPFTEDDHRRLAEILNDRELWICSYSKHPLIEELYSSYQRVEIRKHSGIMDTWHTELIILSHGVANKHKGSPQLKLF